MSLRRFITPALVLVVLFTAWYSEAVVNPPHADGKVHIVYWEKWTDFEGAAIRAVVDSFNRKQNRIHVDLLTISGIENKVLLAAAGGVPPDVAGLYGPNVAQYAADNAVIPLDDYCRANGIRRDNYISVYFDIGTYAGHQYALPTAPASTALHYNKAMFQAAGLDPDVPPKTLEEMDADAEKITTRFPDNKIDKAGFLPAEPGWWNFEWGYIFGGSLWDGKSKITADSPRNLAAYNWVRAYSKKYGSTNLQSFKSGLGNAFSSPQNGFMSGKVAMELQGVWMYNFIDKFAPQMDHPKLEWAAVPFPYPAGHPELANSTFVDEDVVVIPRGAKHPDEAFEFIKYLESQEGMEILCLLQRKHSPLSHVSAGFYKNHPNPFIHLFYDLPQGKNAYFPPKTPIWPEYKDEMTNAFDQIALMNKTPEQALAAVRERMQPKLDEFLQRQRLREEAGR